MTSKDEEQQSSSKMTILEEIRFLREEIENLKRRLYALETLVNWGGSFIKELLEVVGLQ